ncbi:MAG: MFS transporter [Spirochaetes bacterium]|nr:MFS transporter [Spirochaetota bacterium]
MKKSVESVTHPTGARTTFFVMFGFMLLHEADKLLIGPLTTQIMETFQISRTQMGAVSTVALVVGAIFYPLWGWLYDRFSRPKLIALASFIWGSTTWLNAIVPTYPLFLLTRAGTGIDDSSYPGLYSLISDYYPPAKRGKIYGFLQVAQPLGYLLGMILALVLGASLGWRKIFFITGGLGILVSFIVFIFVKDRPRGAAEPELAQTEHLERFKFDWKTVGGLFKKKSLVILFLQGFIGVFPWNVITYWIFDYLKTGRGYNDMQTMMTMVPAVLILAAGYPLGGILGDRLFKKTPKGRVIIGATGVALGCVLLWITMGIPASNKLLFGVLLAATALFMPWASPNVLSSFYDVTEPEIRATTNAAQNFVEFGGSAAAPLIAGIIADHSSLGNAILWICTVSWVVCFGFFIFAGKFIPKDIADLKEKLRKRAAGQDYIDSSRDLPSPPAPS